MTATDWAHEALVQLRDIDALRKTDDEFEAEVKVVIAEIVADAVKDALEAQYGR